MLFYAPKDFARVFNLSRMLPRSQRKREQDSLRGMKAYCEEEGVCRRVSLLAHFDERVTPQLCNGMCDVCRPVMQAAAGAAAADVEEIEEDAERRFMEAGISRDHRCKAAVYGTDHAFYRVYLCQPTIDRFVLFKSQTTSGESLEGISKGNTKWPVQKLAR